MKNYSHLPPSDRTRELEQEYQDFKLTKEWERCCFCDKQMLITEYKHWILLCNRFPYNMKWKICHMLAPKRHVRWCKLNLMEWIELILIVKKGLFNKYDNVGANFGATSSIQDHVHIHLFWGQLQSK